MHGIQGLREVGLALDTPKFTAYTHSMEHMSGGTRWALRNRRGFYLAERPQTKKEMLCWTILVRKPLFGSLDTMREINRSLRKRGERCTPVNFPDSWIPSEPVL